MKRFFRCAKKENEMTSTWETTETSLIWEEVPCVTTLACQVSWLVLCRSVWS